jgi:hypothetical protein
MGVAGTTLANVPGMPQTMGQEIMAVLGISRPPVGVFPSQFEAVARQRLGERVQQAALGGMGGLASVGFGLLGERIGRRFGPVGSIVGGIAGSMIGDAVMGPFIENVNARMMDRAQIQQIFGFNRFNDEQRAQMSDFMRQQFVRSIFSPEEFNTILPAATRAGFFRGVGRGDVAGFQDRFIQAEQTLMEDMFTLQLTGPEGMMAAAELRQGFRRMGVGDPARAGRMFREARVLAQQMAEFGEFMDPTEVVQQQLQMGQAGLQFGIAPQRMMETFATQASMMNRLMREGKLSEDDLALLGGTATDAAQRLAITTAATTRQPIFRAMALAFGSADPTTGSAMLNQAALERIGADRMSFSALSERLTQQMGTDSRGTSRMLTLLANQGKLQSDQMQNQGQMLRSMTDDILRQANLEVTDGTRMFIMQRVFGVGEAESRALIAGLPGEKADRDRLEREAVKFDQEVKGAVEHAQTGFAREMTQFFRGIQNTIGKPLDDISRSISNSVAPPLQQSVDRLESIDRKIGGGSFQSRSPISVGPIDFSGNTGAWMIPKDSSEFQSFRAVQESRMFPKPMIHPQVRLADVRELTDRRKFMETMAG